jgi:hypothetical protein
MTRNTLRTLPFLAALLVLLVAAPTPAQADEPPSPSPSKKCSGGDAGTLGLWLGLAAVPIALRRRTGR